MHNYDDKYPGRPGFEPGTFRLQASVDTKEPSAGVAVSTLPPFSIPGGMLKLVSAYRRVRQRTLRYAETRKTPISSYLP